MGTRTRLFTAALAAAALAVTGAASAADFTVDFTWDPAQPAPGQTVTFTAQTNTNVKRYEWDVDGDKDEDYKDGGPTATRKFDRAGTYPIRLRITNVNDQKAWITKQVRVSTNLAASFTWSPEAPVDGDQVTLTSTSTSLGTIKEWAWDLDGDGRFDNGTSQQVQTTFGPGAHTVGLRVADDSGAHASDFETIQVAEKPPPAAEAPPAPSGQSWLNPFPTVRIRGRATSGGAHLSLLAVRAPTGSTVKVRCRGSRRCPKHALTRAMTSERIRLRRFERYFPHGTRIAIYIWKSGQVGKYTRFTIRRLVAPRRADRCLFPGGKWPGACPS